MMYNYSTSFLNTNITEKTYAAKDVDDLFLMAFIVLTPFTLS